MDMCKDIIYPSRREHDIGEWRKGLVAPAFRFCHTYFRTRDIVSWSLTCVWWCVDGLAQFLVWSLLRVAVANICRGNTAPTCCVWHLKYVPRAVCRSYICEVMMWNYVDRAHEISKVPQSPESSARPVALIHQRFSQFIEDSKVRRKHTTSLTETRIFV